MGTYHLTSEGIERLHERVKKEGIKRNYPIREVMYPSVNPMGEGHEIDYLAQRLSPD